MRIAGGGLLMMAIATLPLMTRIQCSIVLLKLKSQPEIHGEKMSEIDMEFTSGIAAFEAKEFAKAMQLLSPLAQQGNPHAQYRLAIMAQVGLGTVKNCANAVKWMRAAADQGLALAQHGLGFMYFQGECTKNDAVEAAKWFHLAAAQGLPGSQAVLATMYEQGTGVERDLEEAKKWHALAEKNY